LLRFYACNLLKSLRQIRWVAKGQTILHELIRQNHADYVAALKHSDASLVEERLDLEPFHALLTRLRNEQMLPADVDEESKKARPKLRGEASMRLRFLSLEWPGIC